MTDIKTVKRVTGYRYKCARCGNKWDGRKLELRELEPEEDSAIDHPDQCPKCKKTDWEKPKKKGKK